MKTPKLKNQSGFTLPEIMVSMLIMVGSIYTLSQVFIMRKQDEVQVKYFTQFQSIAQAVISRYYASPGDFPISQYSSNPNTAMYYVACMTPDGRTLVDFKTSVSATAITSAGTSGPCSSLPNTFEVRMIPSVSKPAFTVDMYPVIPPAERDRINFLFPPPFELPYDLSLSTAIRK